VLYRMRNRAEIVDLVREEEAKVSKRYKMSGLRFVG
jgi:hypothetical protein